jgi:hypothetical protein
MPRRVLGPKWGGVVGAVCGVGLCVLPWLGDNRDGRWALIAAGVGPVALVTSVAMLVLPARKLFVPVEEVNGVPRYDFTKANYTPLMWSIAGVGFAAGLGHCLYLAYG